MNKNSGLHSLTAFFVSISFCELKVGFFFNLRMVVFHPHNFYWRSYRGKSRGGLYLFCVLVYLVARRLAFANSPNKGFRLKRASRSQAEPSSSLGFPHIIVNNYRRTEKTESFLLFLKSKEKKRDRKD